MRHQIKDVIAGKKLLTGNPGMTVRAAARAMAERSVGAIPLVDANQGGRLVGIFSERDLLTKVVAPGLDPDRVTVAEVMVTRVSTITSDRVLAEALHLMHQGNFRHVPVVDNKGNLVGMVSSRDALSSDLADYEREVRMMDGLEEIIA